MNMILTIYLTRMYVNHINHLIDNDICKDINQLLDNDIYKSY